MNNDMGSLNSYNQTDFNNIDFDKINKYVRGSQNVSTLPEVTENKINDVSSVNFSNVEDRFALSPRKLHLIYHQLGPSSLRSKDLEGLRSGEALNEMIYQMKSFFNEQNEMEPAMKKRFINIINQLEKAQKYGESINQLNDIKDNNKFEIEVNNIAKKLENEINNLNDELPFLLQGNVRHVEEGGGGGHAVVFEIRKEKDETYSFVINNTGLGINHHEREGKRVKPIIYKNLTKEQLNGEFFSGLIQTIENKKNLKIDSLYQYLDSNLINKEKNNKEPGRSLLAQRRGVCSWKSLSSWIHGQLVPGLTPSSRKKEDQLVYEKFKKFTIEKNLSRIENNDVKFSLTKARNSLFNRIQMILDAIGNLFKMKINICKEYINDKAYELLKKEMEEKLQKIESKIDRLCN